MDSGTEVLNDTTTGRNELFPEAQTIRAIDFENGDINTASASDVEGSHTDSGFLINDESRRHLLAMPDALHNVDQEGAQNMVTIREGEVEASDGSGTDEYHNTVAASTSTLSETGEFHHAHEALDVHGGTSESSKQTLVITQEKPDMATLPQEIFERIFGYLLINPELGEATSVEQRPDTDPGFQYKQFYLVTTVLRVSKALHVRCMQLLYGKNAFYAACLPDFYRLPSDGSRLLSPLTRYWSDDENNPEAGSIGKSLTMVNKWKVFVNPVRINGGLPHVSSSMVTLCRSICRSRPETLKVVIIRKDVQARVSEGDYIDLNIALAPLKLIRGVAKFDLTDAVPSEIPDCIQQDNDSSFYDSLLEEHPILEVELHETCKGRTPVTYCFEIFPRLLDYAQSFEMHDPYRQEMALESGMRLDATKCPGYFEYSSSVYHLDNPLRNPFRDHHVRHPVEDNLEQAKIAGDLQEVEAFTRNRDAVIEFLEPQYQRMSAACYMLVKFIREQQHRRDLFLYTSGHDTWRYCEAECTEAMLLFENVKETFRRDCPQEINEIIADHQLIWDTFYNVEHYKSGVSKMAAFLVIGNFVAFFRLFSDHVDEFWDAFSVIRRARADLLLLKPGWSGKVEDHYHPDNSLRLWEYSEEGLRWYTPYLESDSEDYDGQDDRYDGDDRDDDRYDDHHDEGDDSDDSGHSSNGHDFDDNDNESADSHHSGQSDDGYDSDDNDHNSIISDHYEHSVISESHIDNDNPENRDPESSPSDTPDALQDIHSEHHSMGIAESEEQGPQNQGESAEAAGDFAELGTVEPKDGEIHRFEGLSDVEAGNHDGGLADSSSGEVPPTEDLHEGRMDLSRSDHVSKNISYASTWLGNGQAWGFNGMSANTGSGKDETGSDSTEITSLS